jgi:hypothetical protein
LAQISSSVKVVAMDGSLMTKCSSASQAALLTRNTIGNSKNVHSAQQEHGSIPLSKHARAAHPHSAWPVTINLHLELYSAVLASLDTNLIQIKSSAILSAVILSIGAGIEILV